MAKAKKSKAKKSAPKKKAKKAAKRASAASRRAPAKKAKKAKKAAPRKAAASRKAAAPRKAKKAAPKKKQQVGEGDYQASRTFLKDQSDFVKKNKDKIPAMGREAEKALDGPEGDSLRKAEQEAMNRSTID